MGVHRYEYRIVFGRPHVQPIFEILLLGPTRTLPVPVMLDSGAEFPIFPSEAATQVGIVLPPLPNVHVMYGGSIVPAKKARSTIVIGHKRIQPDIVFVETLLFKHALLGRLGIFAQFNEVCFIERSKTPRIELRW